MRVSIASPLMQPSPNGRRVGIRIVTFEACSGFTRVTARRIAQPPKATFVARLRPGQLPDRAARQLPDLSTIIRVRSSLTDDSRLRGALPVPDSCTAAKSRLFDDLICPLEIEQAHCHDDCRNKEGRQDRVETHGKAGATARKLAFAKGAHCRDAVAGRSKCYAASGG